jgi:hypothetical protein
LRLLARRVRMSDFAKELKEGVRRVEGGNVIVPQGLWDAMIDALEDYGLLKAMEEAEGSPSLTRDQALEYLKELEQSESNL